MLKAINHINIVVSDLERSVAFYTKLLGFVVSKRARLGGEWFERIVGLSGVDAEVAYIQPPGAGPRLELLCYHAPRGASVPETARPNTLGLRHIALEVADIDAMSARLAAAGVEFVGPPVAVPPNALKHDEGYKRLCYFHDPDGVLLELAEYAP